jgi:hypothetical protein
VYGLPREAPSPSPRFSQAVSWAEDDTHDLPADRQATLLHLAFQARWDPRLLPIVPFNQGPSLMN